MGIRDRDREIRENSNFFDGIIQQYMQEYRYWYRASVGIHNKCFGIGIINTRRKKRIFCSSDQAASRVSKPKRSTNVCSV